VVSAAEGVLRGRTPPRDLAFELVEAPVYGSISGFAKDGSLTYTPNLNWCGNDTFKFKATFWDEGIPTQAQYTTEEGVATFVIGERSNCGSALGFRRSTIGVCIPPIAQNRTANSGEHPSLVI